jgi:hypothetical protein
MNGEHTKQLEARTEEQHFNGLFPADAEALTLISEDAQRSFRRSRRFSGNCCGGDADCWCKAYEPEEDDEWDADEDHD